MRLTWPNNLVPIFFFSVGLVLGLPGTDPDIPPHVQDIPRGGMSCTVVLQPIVFVDKDGKIYKEETKYETHAQVDYDGVYPIWRKMLSSRTDDVEAYRDCVAWVKKVQKARDGDVKPAVRKRPN